MKMFFSSLVLILSVLALSGCSTCGKKSACTNCATPVATQQVAPAPVVPAVVEKAAPVVEKKMTQEQIMRAVSK